VTFRHLDCEFLPFLGLGEGCLSLFFVAITKYLRLDTLYRKEVYLVQSLRGPRAWHRQAWLCEDLLPTRATQQMADV
jgi:hypothetical protein